MTFHELILPTLDRWLGLLALAVLVGGLVVDVIVLPRGVDTRDPARWQLRAWTSAATMVLIVTSVGDLIARAAVMTGGDVSRAAAALPLVLMRTHFGAVWIARVVGLVLLVAVSFARSRPARIVGLVLSLGVVLSGSLTGHAADRGDLSLAVLVEWLHAVAASAWTGGLFTLALTIRRPWVPERLAIIAPRFSRLAGYCLPVVIASGLYNAWVELPTLAALWSTTYGRALFAKIVLAVALAVLGAINRYLVLPDLGESPAPRMIGRLRRLGRMTPFGGAPTPAAATATLSRLVAREAMIAVVVFGCTAVLGESTPKSHGGHAAHPAAHEPSRSAASSRLY